MTTSLFLKHSIRNLLHLIRKKQLAAIDLADMAINRIEGMNGEYHCFVSYDAEGLRDAARQSEKRLAEGQQARSLEAVPISVKDNINTKHFPTQMGSPCWSGFTPGNNARAVDHIVWQGAAIAGKTVTTEFAVHDLSEAVNPYDKARTPGTSSSGSAVAVAAGMIPAALDTQTAGSIIQSASFCGVFGYKPSFGLIPRTGILKTTDTLDTVGFFTAHAEDLPILFDALRVKGQDYPISHAALSDESRQNIANGKPWRVALVKDHTWKYAPDYAQKAMCEFSDSLNALGNICVSERSLPEIMLSAHETHATIYNKDLAYYFKDEYVQKQLVSGRICSLIESGLLIDPKEYLSALKAQEAQCRAMDDFFSDCDVLICLSTAGEAPLRGVEAQPDSALLWALTHLPAISVPAFKGLHGLPFGVQIVARKYSDYKLLRFIDLLCEKAAIPGSAASAVD